PSTELSTLSLHDALPISGPAGGLGGPRRGAADRAGARRVGVPRDRRPVRREGRHAHRARRLTRPRTPTRPRPPDGGGGASSSSWEGGPGQPPMTTRRTPFQASGSVVRRPSTSTVTSGRSVGVSVRYSAWSACRIAAVTFCPACGVSPRAESSSAVYIGSETYGTAPRALRASTVGKTPENAVSFTPPR